MQQPLRSATTQLYIQTRLIPIHSRQRHSIQAASSIFLSHHNESIYRNEDQLGNTRLDIPLNILLEATPDATAAINASSICQMLRKTEPNADQNQNGTDESRIIHANNLIHATHIAAMLIDLDEDLDHPPLFQTPLEAYAEDSSAPIDPPEILPLPKAIAECIAVEDHSECNTHLATLTAQKQRDVFVVYEDIIQRDGVHYPLPLFKSLVEKAKKTGSQGLSVPQGIAKAKARKVSEANKITHPSMIIQTPEVRAERERQELASQDESLRSMLRINSQLQGMSVEELAEKLLLTHLLPV